MHTLPEKTIDAVIKMAESDVKTSLLYHVGKEHIPAESLLKRIRIYDDENNQFAFVSNDSTTSTDYVDLFRTYHKKAFTCIRTGHFDFEDGNAISKDGLDMVMQASTDDLFLTVQKLWRQGVQFTKSQIDRLENCSFDGHGGYHERLALMQLKGSSVIKNNDLMPGDCIDHFITGFHVSEFNSEEDTIREAAKFFRQVNSFFNDELIISKLNTCILGEAYIAACRKCNRYSGIAVIPDAKQYYEELSLLLGLYKDAGFVFSPTWIEAARKLAKESTC